MQTEIFEFKVERDLLSALLRTFSKSVRKGKNLYLETFKEKPYVDMWLIDNSYYYIRRVLLPIKEYSNIPEGLISLNKEQFKKFKQTVVNSKNKYVKLKMYKYTGGYSPKYVLMVENTTIEL
jgi:predicted rRNA methylase YqxC with S4 and FtsJ domains